MNKKNFLHWMMLSLLTTLAILACNISASTPAAIPVTGENTATEAIPIATEQPTSTPIVIIREVTVTGPAPTSRPICTVVQDNLNLRSGPGTAYRPPITSLPVNSELTPLGFAPEGIPGGSWAYVQDSASQDKGWVNAASQYITCNIDVTALPQMAFDPPTPPSLPDTSQASPGPGTCGQGGIFSDNGVDVYDCDVVFSDKGFLQFKVLKNGEEIGKDGGVQNVNFSVDQNGETVYNHTENNAPYCIFGGDDRCNSWVLEDYTYKWEAGGSVVEKKKYTVSITANLDDPSVNLFWSADVKITLP
jgi:hypothetical protein